MTVHKSASYYYIIEDKQNSQQRMIDAETSMKNESMIIDQLSKQEEPIEDSELNNQQAVRKIVKRYQNKINQMLKLIKSQKAQNDHLKSELKSLNQNLNGVINKLNPKNVKANNEAIKDETIKRELENQIKKNVLLQKELQQLRVKIKGIDTQKIQEMQNEIKEKDRKIEELGQSIKMYQKIQRQDKNLDIYKKQQELVNKVNSLNEEVIHLRNKLAKQKKQEEMQEKMMKRQHEQILSLEAKVKQTSAPIQKQSAAQPLSKSDSSKKLGYLKQKYGAAEMSRPENNKNLKPKTKKSERESLLQQVSELEERCENLQVTKRATEKHLRFEIQNLKNKIKALQSELSESRNLLRRKDQEANILVSKVKENQRKNYNTLEPVEKIKLSEDFGANALFDQRKQFRGLVHSQGNYRKFDDTEGLSLQKNYRIKSFVFSWFQEHILSLETTYELKDGSEKQVCSFKITHEYKNIKHGELEMSDFEYIKQVELYCGKFIQFIKIQTSRDKVLEVGNYKNLTKCKKFQFDIRTNQKPIAFLGAIDNKKILGMEGNRELLISFGLEIKKKDVVGKSRYNPSRTASLVKSSSKSALEATHPKNDKNIIDDK